MIPIDLIESTAGTLMDKAAIEIPDDFMQQHALTRCSVCSKILSKRFGNACPRCRPLNPKKRKE